MADFEASTPGAGPEPGGQKQELRDRVFTAAGVGLCLLDPEGVVLRANSEWLRSSGLTEAQAFGRRIWDLFPAAPPLMRRMHDEVRSWRSVDVPVHRQLIDGREVWYEGKLSPIPLEDGVGILITAIDVTARQRNLEEVLGREALIRRNAQELRQLTELLQHAPVLVRDLDDRITVWNEGMRTLYGFSDGEALGRVSHELLQTRFPQPLAGIRETLLRTGRWEGELVHRRQDGAELVVKALWVLHRGPTGEPLAMVEVNGDITRRVRAEAALARTERRQAFLADLSEALRPLADPVEVQRAAAWLLGERLGASRVHYGELEEDGQVGVVRAEYRRDLPSTVGRYRLDDYGPAVMSEFRAGRTLVIDDVLHDLRLTAAERRATLALGIGAYVIVPLVKGGAAEGLFVVHQDVPRAWTDEELSLMQATADLTWAAAGRVRAERALRDSELRHRAMFEQAAVGVVQADVGTGRFLRVNARFCQMMGYAPEELLALSWRDLTHPDDLAADLAGLAGLAAAAAAGQPYRREKRYLRKDGGLVWASITVNRIALPGEAPTSMVAVVEEIGERKALEDQLRQAQKLESLGRLAGGVAHDFNNLLTVIQSCAEGIHDSLTRGQPASLEDAEEIQNASRRATDLTRQLLSFARKQVIAPVPTDLGVLVSGSERLLRRLLGEDVALSVQADPGLWLVRCDPGQLEQVILNLAVNGRDAMPRGGRLAIRTENRTVPPDLGATPDLPPGQYVRVRVSDTGVGMPAEVKSHLFEPFFTTKPTGSGTGLGLATSYGIVRQNGGVIRVESEPGQGTTFEILLPRTLEEIPTPATPSSTAARGCEAVLVVEDDPRVQGVTVRALRSGGYAVTVAASPEEALALPAEELARIHLLITDVVMPGIDGRELARELCRRYPRLRVLYVSGYTRDAVAERGVIDAGIEFLPKPFTPQALLNRARAVLDAGGRPGES